MCRGGPYVMNSGPGLQCQAGFDVRLAGLHHVRPDAVRPAFLVEERRYFRGAHVGPRLSRKLQDVGHSDFRCYFLAPTLLLEVNHFCFPTEPTCLTPIEILRRATTARCRKSRPHVTAVTCRIHQEKQRHREDMVKKSSVSRCLCGGSSFLRLC